MTAPNSQTENGGAGSTDSETNHQQQVVQKWSEAQANLEGASNPVEEGEAVKEFIQTLAKADYHLSDSEVNVDGWMTTLRENTDSGKKYWKGVFESFKEDVEPDESEPSELRDNPFSDELIRKKLEKFKQVVNRDADKGAEYVFKFEDGTSFSMNGRWKMEQDFRSRYHEETGVRLRESRENNWFEFVDSYVNEHDLFEMEYVDGPRTSAVNELRDKIQGWTAYTDEKAAAMDGVLYVEDTEEYDTLFIPNDKLRRVAQSHNIENLRTLQSEMSSRELLNGSAESNNFADGTYIRWWKVDSDFADPAEIKEVDSIDELRGDAGSDEFAQAGGDEL